MPADLYIPYPGTTFTDTELGTSIKRITNAVGTADASRGDAYLSGINVEYSTISPFNSDNSRLLLLHGGYFALYDGRGNYLKDLRSGEGFVLATAEPRWLNNPNDDLLYVAGNRLMLYNIDYDDVQETVVFPEYQRIHFGGEGDLSEDGNYIAMAGELKDGSTDIFAFEMDKLRNRGMLNVRTGIFDSLYMTPDNDVIVNFHAKNGEAEHYGVELYDRHMKFKGRLADAFGHMDVGRDSNGDACIVWAGGSAETRENSNSIIKIRCKDGQRTNLLTMNETMLNPEGRRVYNVAFHVTLPRNAKGFGFVETYAPYGGPDIPYKDEILRIDLDGKEPPRRIAHHRSRPHIGNADQYSWQPKLSCSWDGTKLVYSSNFGQLERGPAYSDVYLIDLAVAGQPAPPEPVPEVIPLEPVATIPVKPAATEPAIDHRAEIISQLNNQVAQLRLEIINKTSDIGELGRQIYDLKGTLHKAQSAQIDPAIWNKINFLNPSQVGRAWAFEVLEDGLLRMYDVEGMRVDKWKAIEQKDGNQFLFVAKDGALEMYERKTNK